MRALYLSLAVFAVLFLATPAPAGDCFAGGAGRLFAPGYGGAAFAAPCVGAGFAPVYSAGFQTYSAPVFAQRQVFFNAPRVHGAVFFAPRRPDFVIQRGGFFRPRVQLNVFH